MTLVFDDLVADADWLPMDLDQQHFPSYFWHAGGLLRDAPVDFRATFDGAMWVTTKPIDMPRFNRNPLRVRAHFTVPRHHHNMDEMLFVLAGEYSIEYDEDQGQGQGQGQGGGTQTVRVGPGDFFLSRAGTPYTMTAGPEGVTYIETWPKPVTQLETYWHDVGWVRR